MLYDFSHVPSDYDAKTAVMDIMLQLNEAGKTGNYEQAQLEYSAVWAAISEISARVDSMAAVVLEEKKRTTPFPRKWVDPVRK